jgi:glycerol uptake facilitator-like aquaporin
MNLPQPAAPSSASDLAIRTLYMVLFAVVFWILSWTLGVTAIVQLLIRLSSGHTNPEVTRFGAALARYARQIIEFLTFVTEILPYPFSAWPGEG